MRYSPLLCLLLALCFTSTPARAQTIGDQVLARVPFCLSLEKAQAILRTDAEQGFPTSKVLFDQEDDCDVGVLEFVVVAVKATYQVQRGGKEALMYIVQGKLTGDDTPVFILTPVKVKTKEKDA